MKDGRLLAIDHGIKRIGLAVSDYTWLIARELMILKRKSRKEDFERLQYIISEQKVCAVVIGLPSNGDMPDDTHTQADTVRLWATRFSNVISDLPIVFWDEQLSSIDALELAKQKKRHYREPVDDLAARIILQRYLDALRDGIAPHPSESIKS